MTLDMSTLKGNFFFFVTYLFFMFVEEKYKKNKKWLSKFLTLNHLLAVLTNFLRQSSQLICPRNCQKQSS